LTALCGDQRMSDMVLFLGGDVMTGRGIDQILPHPVDPELREPWIRSAIEYVELAERAHGQIERPVAFDYIWGDALAELDAANPDVRIINLETSVTKSGDALPKPVTYRMSPDNVPCITAARIDCCLLANNHVIDYGRVGLAQTLEALRHAGVAAAGAGLNADEAAAPAIREVVGKGRVLVFGAGTTTCGILPQWAAGHETAGINVLPDLSQRTLDLIADHIRAVKQAGDVVVASIHWGPNWGYEIPLDQRTFAQRLVAQAGVDVVHGHSSHHAKAVEVYGGKLILYGCGDFLNDYEGISGYEEFRADLALMYLPSIAISTGTVSRLAIVPFHIAKMRLTRASEADAEWICTRLNREGKQLGTQFELHADGKLELGFSSHRPL
jgi:poly-gamma-glutamate capsule biosynthesis protein CapA/YwtB (metallophosphatase superfamily)